MFLLAVARVQYEFSISQSLSVTFCHSGKKKDRVGWSYYRLSRDTCCFYARNIVVVGDRFQLIGAPAKKHISKRVRCDLLSSVRRSIRGGIAIRPCWCSSSKSGQDSASCCRLRMRFPLALFDTILQRDVGETLLHAFIKRTRQHYVRRCGTPARTVLALCNIQSRRSAISLFRRSFLCAWRILHTQTFVSEEKRRLLVYRRMIFRTILNDIRLYLTVFRSSPLVTNLAECIWHQARYNCEFLVVIETFL